MNISHTRWARAGVSVIGAVSLLATSGCSSTAADTGDTNSSKSSQTETITITDDQKRTVKINGPVESAVVLNSYAVEFTNAIGAGDKIIGTDRTSQRRLGYLDFQDDEIVAESIAEINYESVAALDPDVVIIPRNGSWEDAAKQLEQFDIPVAVVTAWDYQVFDTTVDLLGKIFAEESGATKVSDFYHGIFDEVDKRVKGTQEIATYWETTDPYLTVLPGSGFHAIIEAANGRNVFEDFSVGASNDGEATVDPTDVVERNPEVIVFEFEPSSTPTGDATFNERFAEIQARPGFDQIDAVKNKRVYVANGWATSAVAKAIGAIYLAKWLHPEQFEDIDPGNYLKQWVTEFQGAPYNAESDYIRKLQ
ncbi:MAG: ABC transporter substrate-binding protein [Bifidobacterium sp.]|jgi:iron complex transport system substrate-binding protein|nr:ABC transporter substrate-binding protein [Bifidobacterium sp.]MCH4174231.1 ABC transporter substrate-binding protein [Bifidobacterium sp.]